jgi:hypothetical protein
MGPPDAGHIGKLGLRQAMLFPEITQTPTETNGKRNCHSPIFAGIFGGIVRYTEQYDADMNKRIGRQTGPEGQLRNTDWQF